MARYQRQMTVIGHEGQEKLSRARVMIVGLGGIGSPVALYLAAAGVGTLMLVDSDNVELTNLHRQILYKETDLGQSKAEKAKTRLTQINSNIKIEAYSRAFDEEFGASLLSEVDLVIDGTDNFETRYLINDLCAGKKKVFISCSILVNIIQFALFDTQHVCYRCLYPESPPVGLRPNCSEAGVLGSATGIAGTMTANLAIQYLLGEENATTPQIRLFDAKTFTMSSLPIKKNKSCIACVQHQNTLRVSQNNMFDFGIDLEQLDNNKHFLVDIRRQDERELFKLDDDLFFPINERTDYEIFLSHNNKQLVFYCAAAVRSKWFATELRKLGVDAYYLKTRLPK